MNINTGLPLPFLLIKLTPLISISSVTEVSVFLRRLYPTEVFNSVCVKSQKDFWVRDKFVRPAISGVWLHFRCMSWSAKRSLCWQLFSFLLCTGKNSSTDSQATEIRPSSILREFCGNQTCEQSTYSCFVLFSCFFPYGFKYFRTLVVDISATNFLGCLVLFRKSYAPICSVNKVFSALRGAHLTKKAVFLLITVAIHSC